MSHSDPITLPGWIYAGLLLALASVPLAYLGSLLWAWWSA